MYLNLSELAWQGIFGFLDTVLIGLGVGILSIKWLGKRDAINASEGERLKQRMEIYLNLLEIFRMMEEKVIVWDLDRKIRDRLIAHRLPDTFGSRNGVEYWGVLKNQDTFMDFFKQVDAYYHQYMHLLDQKSAKLFFLFYGYGSRINGYYTYLQSILLPDGRELAKADRDEIIEDFFETLGMVIDRDLAELQARLERSVVQGLYRLDFFWSRDKMYNRTWMENYLLKYLMKTDLFLYEQELFDYFIFRICDHYGLSYEENRSSFPVSDLILLFPEEGRAAS